MPTNDLISRQAAIDEVRQAYENDEMFDGYEYRLGELPSAQPDLSEAYAKAVWAWLLDYQIKAAELKGKYEPYEVLSWVANDWRKEHECK